VGQIFPCGNKGKKEGGGRILLGDNTGGGVAMLFRWGSGVLEFGFKLDFLVCAYVIDPIYTQFRLGQNSTWNITTAKVEECFYILKFF